MSRAVRGPGPALLVAAVVIGLAACALAGAAAAAGRPLALARLQGRFALSGKVTVARAILGEYAGQKLTRSWRFTPACAAGPCATVLLARARGRVVDRLVLRRRTSTFYVGTGRFFVPVICGGRRYNRGELVRYTVGVQVTAAALTRAGVRATRVRAFYRNPYRLNLTPCVASPGHDAAVYTGALAAARV